MHCSPKPERGDRERPTRPAVVVAHHPHSGDHATLRDIRAGLEEEGVPGRTEVVNGDPSTSASSHAGAAALAHHAAETSPLDVGVGLTDDSTVCVHHAKLAVASPVLVAAADAARLLGHNAARLVVGIPLKRALNGCAASDQTVHERGASTVTTEQLSLADARHVLDAGLEHADRIEQPMNVAVVDSGAHLVAFARQDGAILGSIDVAIRKARTAALFRMTTAELGVAARPDGPLHAIELTNEGLVVFGGGVPLFGQDGGLAGAVGVSAGSVEQDMAVAQAGVDSYVAR